MNKSYLFALIVWSVATSAFAQVSGSAPSVDDLIPPLSGGETTVQDEDGVAVEKNGDLKIVNAATQQDAANASVDVLKQNDVGGCVQMKFPSGEGYVAMGIAAYDLSSNVDKTRVAKRRAFVRAYIDAKIALASTLGSPEVKNQIDVDQYSETLLGDEETRYNNADVYTEKLNSIVRHLIQGHVIYKVEDERDEQFVRVFVFTTPKTIAAVTRTGQVYMDAGDLKTGVEKVLETVRAGVVPPLGGTIVTVPGDQQAVAFVAFGSAAITTPKNGAPNSERLRLRQRAYHIADMRAEASMLELLKGDKAKSSRDFLESATDASRDFASTLEGDPTESQAFAALERLAEQTKTRRDVNRFYRQTSSGQNGKLPSGINSQSWTDDDGAWVYCVKVYLPATTAAPFPPTPPQPIVNPEIPTGVITDPLDM